MPPSSSVHALTGTLRAVADAIEASTPPHVSWPLPADPELETVTAAVRSELSVLIRSEEGLAATGDNSPAPTPA